ncbi:sensor domain-containing diguanylate cyclase [Polaromonas aquatica]|uniref:sensor domain-containing diguanylate cyclase n=1 Tax=Polaromonas aquatica TaxID=332657 RepID=UPI003D646FBB
MLAGSVRAQPVVSLNDTSPTLDVSTASSAWVDPDGQAGIDQLAGGRPGAAFVPAGDRAVYSLGPNAALWLHYRLSKASDSRQDWLLEFPIPLLDLVTVYQRTPSGGWTSKTAGDTVAVSTWPEPGRYGRFRLNLPDSGVHDVYVRIQHQTEISIPVRVSTQSSLAQRLQLEYLAIGAVFGALVLLIIACAVQSWIYRDRAYGWYAVYATIMALVVAAWTGLAGHILWGNFSTWNNMAQGCLAILGGGSALLVVHHLCGPGPRYKWFERFAYRTGVAGVPLALVYLFLERGSGVRLIGVYLIAVVLLGISRAYMTWRRQDIVGFWVMAAFTPLGLVTLFTVTSIFGLYSVSWLSQYGLMVALTLEVPLLLIALNTRSHERHAVEAREQAMSSQDALTGLLAAHLFHDRFKQVVGRAQRHQEPAAVVYIELVNYRYIKKTWGTAVAEQSLLRSVIKLRRILRDVNTVGRIDEARFGLILEGVASRSPVTELAARLIAAGLMPLKGLKPEVVLQFHVAGVLLSERLGSHEQISTALGDLLHSMASRTRRPIRFLEPESTHPMPLDTESALDSLSSGPQAPQVLPPPAAAHAPPHLRAVKSHSNR